MRLKETDRLVLPASADMHVHLRQAKLMELVTPQIRRGGVDTVFVMVCYTIAIDHGMALLLLLIYFILISILTCLSSLTLYHLLQLSKLHLNINPSYRPLNPR